MASGLQNTDDLIRQLGGCSVLQFASTSLGALAYMCSAFTMIFMSFGMHNPGWRCTDNNTTQETTFPDTTGNRNTSNEANSVSESSFKIPLIEDTLRNLTFGDKGFTDSCVGFQECPHVQFNPKESTIVTEWNLICVDSWKGSTITSIQMAGMTVGFFVSGYLGDAYGRKLTLGIHILIKAILTVVSVASISWEMFAVLKFFVGISCGILFCISIVYTTEFVTPKWRSIIPSIPMWVSGCIMFCLLAMAFKDWRYLHIFDCAMTILLLIPSYFCPESLRWLVIKKKEKKSSQVVAQMAKWNRRAISEDILDRLAMKQEAKKIEFESATKLYSFVSLFKAEARKYTLVLSSLLFIQSVVYYSSSFGVSLLSGDLYTNNLIIHILGLPGNVIGWFAPNVFGRKPTGVAMCLLLGVSLAIFVALDVYTSGSIREIGMLVFIIVARNCCSLNWYIVLTCTGELFPTTIRATATGWMMFVSGVGGAMSPYLVITTDVMHVTYLVMAVLSVADCLMFYFIPETLGTDLTDCKTTSADFKDVDDSISSQDLQAELETSRKI